MNKKTVFVTGGFRGIGRVICLELSRRGANAAFLYRSDEVATAETRDSLEAMGSEVLSFKADVHDRHIVAAGLIPSKMAAAGLANEAVRKAAKGIPPGRLGSLEEVARAVGFPAADEASSISAQTLNVNGGLYF